MGVLQAVVVAQAAATNDQTPMKIALFNPDGTPYADAGANAKLDGYTEVAGAPVTATDSVLTAIAKLEARVEELENP